MKTIVVCGLDHKLRWMYDWFNRGLTENVRNHEVVVYDFGLSTPIDRPVVQGSKTGWFAKPSAISKTFNDHPEADSVLWIDLDVEILRPIDDVLERAIKKDRSIVACPDPYMPNRFLNKPQPYILPNEHYQEGRTKGMVLNTGFLYIRRDFLLLHKWMLTCMYRQHRGDQEALADYIRCGDVGVGTFTKHDCVLRLAPAKWRENTCAIHWTGNEGKCIIREKIVQNRVLSIANQSKEVKNDG